MSNQKNNDLLGQNCFLSNPNTVAIKKKKIDINLNISVDLANQNRIAASSTAHIQLNKVETDMSVAQLAYLCRIFHDLGYITNHNQTEVLKVAAHNFITSNTQEISFKSLKAKYYNIDQSTRDSLKKRLLEMLDYIDQKET